MKNKIIGGLILAGLMYKNTYSNTDSNTNSNRNINKKK